jgi:predicted CXXCH cytochrome family protein
LQKKGSVWIGNHISQLKKGKEIKMKKVLLLVLVVSMIAAAASLSFAAISATKHNLTANSQTGNTQTTRAQDGVTTASCRFCHVPHSGTIGAQNPPLWGRKTGTGTYKAYGAAAAGNAGVTAAGTAVSAIPGQRSLTCLSCHDGTISIGVTTKNNVDATVTMQGNVTGAGLLNPANFAATAYNPVIGTDLTNDHPVGLTYGGSGIIGPGLVDAAGGKVIGVYPLFGAGTDQMECSTCHDPHTTNTSFLRVDIASVDICADCHANK